MGRKKIEHRDLVRRRINVMVLPEVKIMAKRLGGGNVSAGIEKAVSRLYLEELKNSEV